MCSFGNCDCCDLECDDCEEEDEAEGAQDDAATDVAADSDDESEDDEFDEEEERVLLEKMRLARMNEMKSKSSEVTSRRKDGFGSYTRLSQAQLLRLLQHSEAAVICHLALDGCAACEWLDQILSAIAPKHEMHRFVRISAEVRLFAQHRGTCWPGCDSTRFCTRSMV